LSGNDWLWDPRNARLAQPRLFLLVLPVAGGVGLLTYALAGVSLPLGMSVTALLGVSAVWAVLGRAPLADRSLLLTRLRIGLAAGLAATIAYDLVRIGIVRALGLSFWPFETFAIFGRLIVGERLPTPWPLVVGTLYHFLNGVGFAMAFVLAVRRPRPWSGLAWAMILEGLMLSVYPRWLRIRAFDQFVLVSLVGHAVWGMVLGTLAERWLRSPQPRPSGSTLSAVG